MPNERWSSCITSSEGEPSRRERNSGEPFTHFKICATGPACWSKRSRTLLRSILRSDSSATYARECGIGVGLYGM